MRLKSQFCSNCYFFLKTGQNENGQIGYCRANPPSAFYESGSGKPQIARFPIVLSEMWCGMWDANEGQTEVANNQIQP